MSIASLPRTLWYWAFSNAHMTKQTLNVLDFMWVHRVEAGLLPPDHPWLTGMGQAAPGETIWARNIVFASPRGAHVAEAASDEEIVTAVGRFLAAMVQRSNVAAPEIPQGRSRRMPHAVNYLHGPVHHNGGYVLFDDFSDAMFHLSDRTFAAEFLRFAKEERRELTIVLRDRHYDPEEYAWFVAFVRAHLPWYCNGNGPTRKRVLHGTPSPYPVVNPINGTWIGDVRRLQRGERGGLARPPIEARYFTGAYAGTRTDYLWMERLHAWLQWLVTEAKGFQGGLVFTRRALIEPHNLAAYVAGGGKWRPGYTISHPFRTLARARARRARRSD
ncbi:MAG TPA: hypothetical protein VEZ20_08010 [Allosphingosinicella sp.]|jgi:hypothetical protein|nr:hypothetical protein [Allosphingosinicella sp.]